MREKGKKPCLTSRQFGGSWDEIVCCCLQPFLIHCVWRTGGRRTGRRGETEIFGLTHPAELCDLKHHFEFFYISNSPPLLNLLSITDSVKTHSLVLLCVCWSRCFTYLYSPYHRTPSPWGGSLNPESLSAVCHSPYLEKKTWNTIKRHLHSRVHLLLVSSLMFWDGLYCKT